MASASKVMAEVGKVQDPQKVAQTMQQFQKENAKMDMASEMIGDALDDALGSLEEEEETDELVGQVLDEIGVDMAGQLGSAPRKNPNAQQAAEEAEADELVARLAQLKA